MHVYHIIAPTDKEIEDVARLLNLLIYEIHV